MALCADCIILANQCRESKYAAIKHHWWWKTSFVFDSLHALSSYAGVVLFLEEDHVLLPDALHVLALAAAALPAKCPECIITLGTVPSGSFWQLIVQAHTPMAGPRPSSSCSRGTASGTIWAWPSTGIVRSVRSDVEI